MKKNVAAIAMTIVLSVSCAQQYMGHKVTNMNFSIAGGDSISLPVTDAGAIPAENERIKIEFAGFDVAPVIRQGNVPGLTWVFGFTSKVDQKIESVTIEEVYSGDTARMMIDDKSPHLKGKTWSIHTTPVEVSRDAFPWLYASKATVFVFKFTISIDGSNNLVLYQPVWFPEKTKMFFVDHADQIRK